MNRSGPLARKTPLQPGKPPVRKVALNRSPFSTSAVHVLSAVNQRQPKRAPAKLPRNTGPTAAVVALVFKRDEGRCFRCGIGVRAEERGAGWSCQHRRARGNGGTRRPDANLPQNLIVLCGSATTPGGCHEHVESRRIKAREFGWAIRQTDNPLLVPVLHWRDGWLLLADDGSTSLYDAEEATDELSEPAHP